MIDVTGTVIDVTGTAADVTGFDSLAEVKFH